MKNEKISRSLGVVEGKCNLILSTLQDHRKDIDTLYRSIEKKTSALEARVATLEKKQYSILALGGILFTAGLAFIKKFFY